MFEVYKPEPGFRLGGGKWISVASNGHITVSREAAEHMGVTEGVRHEVYFDRESRSIGIKFVPAESNGYSRACTFCKGGAVQINATAVFKKFGLKTPAKGTRFTPSANGGMLVFEYPEIMVSAK